MRSKILCSIFVMLVSACKTTTTNQLKHNIGEPTWQGSFDYYDMSFDEYTRSTIGPFLAENHDLTVFVQNWIDHIDSTLRAQFPQRLKLVPKPKAAIRKASEVGAYTAGPVSVCFRLPIRINPDVTVSEATTLSNITVNNGRLSPSSYPNCKEIDVLPSQYEEFVSWYNGRFAPCQLAYRPESDAPVVMTGECPKQDFFPTKSLAKRLETKAAPNRILFFTGTFLALDSEEEFVATLAHELGHYYRAHVVNGHRYDFCYDITTATPGQRPVPDPSVKDLCDKMNPFVGFSPTEAASRKLGYYTIEQEADELALEFMSYVGVKPEHAIGAWFNLGKEFSTQPKPHEIPLADCRVLRDRGWKNENGSELFVPLGNYRDRHHSWCYRIFNTDREISSHEFDVSQRVMPVQNWSLVQSMAQ